MKLLTILLSCVFLLSCSLKGLTIPNTDWYRDKGPLGARKSNNISGESQDIGKEDWDEIRFGMFCTDEENFGKYQKFIEDACIKIKNCDVEQIKEQFETIKKLLKDDYNVATH